MGIEAFQASDQIASGINMHLHAELLHPVGQQLTALHILRREPASTHAAVRFGANAGQLLNRSYQPVTVRTCDNFASLNPGCRGGR